VVNNAVPFISQTVFFSGKLYQNKESVEERHRHRYEVSCPAVAWMYAIAFGHLNSTFSCSSVAQPSLGFSYHVINFVKSI